MAFGDGLIQGGPVLSICCGPRCGAEPGHRVLYDAIEKRMASAFAAVHMRPTMCQGLCGGGVTVTVKTGPNDAVIKQKIRDVSEARAFVYPISPISSKDS